MAIRDELLRVAPWSTPNFFDENQVSQETGEDSFFTKPKLLQQADDEDALRGLCGDVAVQQLLRQLFKGLRGFGSGFANSPPGLGLVNTPSPTRPGISPSIGRPQPPDRTPSEISAGAGLGA